MKQKKNRPGESGKHSGHKNLNRIFVICSVFAGLMLTAACRDSWQNRLKSMSGEFERLFVIDNLTRVDTVKYLPGAVWAHITWLSEEDDGDERDFMKEIIPYTCKDAAVRNMCRNGKMTDLISEEGIVVYISCSDMAGVHLADTWISSEDIKGDISGKAVEKRYVESFSKYIRKFRESITFPYDIGDGLFLTFVDFIESAKITEYVYSFECGYGIEDLDIDIEDFGYLMKQWLKSQLGESKAIVELINRGFVWRYIFFDSDNTVLATFVFDEVEDLE